jgi:hypothetical protein
MKSISIRMDMLCWKIKMVISENIKKMDGKF